jgi:hypothetical protein
MPQTFDIDWDVTRTRMKQAPVVTKLEEIPWQGSVASVTGSKIMISAGTNIGLKTGFTLKLLAKGEEVLDPDDGSSLGFSTEETGTVRITGVQERFSTCEITDGGNGVKKGDVVRFEPQKKYPASRTIRQRRRTWDPLALRTAEARRILIVLDGALGTHSRVRAVRLA